MTNVYSYFGIQDVHDLAERVLKGDGSDLGSRAKVCTQTAQTVRSIATDLHQLSDRMFQSWTGVGADAATVKMASIVVDRHRQADQLTRSADAFTACDNALVDAQRQAREIVAQAETMGHVLDVALPGVQSAMNAMTGGGVLEWGVKKLTGVDIEAEGRKLLLGAVRPIYEEALGLLDADLRRVRCSSRCTAARRRAQTTSSWPRRSTCRATTRPTRTRTPASSSCTSHRYLEPVWSTGQHSSPSMKSSILGWEASKRPRSLKMSRSPFGEIWSSIRTRAVVLPA